jgi:hypothetical protein
MTDERFSGLALIAGAAASIITMIFHPTGHQMLTPGAVHSTTQLAIAVHALALLSLPVLFVGTIGLSRCLAPSGRLPLVALTTYGFATVAVMNAAVVSGFVSTAVAGRIADSANPATDLWRALFHYSGDLNQGFALVFVVASSIAILLWSIAALKARFGARAVAMYGCFIAPISIVAVLSGHLRLNVHGFGAIVFTQAVWLIFTGAYLMRKDSR